MHQILIQIRFPQVGSLQIQSQFPPGHLLLCFSQVLEPKRDIEQGLLAQFSTSEKARLESIKSSSRRSEYLCSRILMRDALNQIFEVANLSWEFEEQNGYSPRVSNLPSGIHTTLSHSRGVICFAISDMPIGVDIEAHDRQRDFNALGKLFMNDLERKKLATLAEPAAYFYRCWCVKEAYYKAQPTADQEHLHFTGISIDDIDRSNDGWHLTEGKIEDHYLVAVSRQRPSQIQCHYFPSQNSWRTPFARTTN